MEHPSRSFASPRDSDAATPRRRSAVALVVTAGIFASAAGARPADAQINIEKIRVGVDQPGWAGTLDVNAALHRGNIRRDVIGGGARIQYAWPPPEAEEENRDTDDTETNEPEADGVPPKSVAFLTSNYSFTRLSGSRFVNNALSHLRFIRQHNSRIAFEVFGQHQFNEFIRLAERILLGGGSRFAVVRGQQMEVFAGSGYMLEREALDLPPSNPEPRQSEHHRSTNYVTVRYNTPDRRIRFVHTTYAQIRVDRIEDFRLLAETSFEIQLRERLALAINLTTNHDTDPPVGIKDTDVVLSNSLRYSF